MLLAPVLILAIGNESRGDDALGPLLLRQLQVLLEEQELTSDFDLIEEFQLQIENTIDMVGRELVLLIDAGANTQAPYRFYQATPKPLEGHTTHAVAPETLLGVYSMVHGEAPPPLFILCVAGKQFELGESISSEAKDHLDASLNLARKLLQHATPEHWQQVSDNPKFTNC